MLLVNTVRDESDRTKHHLSFTEVKFDDILNSNDDHENKVKALVQKYTTMLEEQVRKDPTHYWWIHKRFKTRPDKNISFYK